MKRQFKSDIARNYVKQFPKTSSLSLARKMFVENVEWFKDIEDARGVIRYVRGLNGKQARKHNSHKELFVPKFSLGNPYQIPKSHATKQKIFHIPPQHNRILVISDLHVPYHDVTAISIAIKYGIDNGANCILINGDLLDFFQISRFTKTKRKRSVSQELATARAILDRLNDAFPNTPIYFLEGNHDVRLELYLAEKAPELLDCEEFKLEVLLDAKKRNMVVFEDRTLIKAGKLTITHGHLLIKGFFAPVSPARGAFLKAKSSVLIGHTHKVSTHTETTIVNKMIVCYSTGCLCELQPDYNPFGNNYSHGFAFIVTEPNGHYQVKNVQILDGVIIN
jgi:predicted phosphodiesterase